MDKVKAVLLASCVLAWTCFVSGCVGLSQNDKVALFTRLSNVGSISEESIRQLKLEGAQNFGVHRAVVPITAAEAKRIQSEIGEGKWMPGPVPAKLWKSTIMMGTDKPVPVKFVPVYTNQLIYCTSDDISHKRTYVMDVSIPSNPTLYFVHIQW